MLGKTNGPRKAQGQVRLEVLSHLEAMGPTGHNEIERACGYRKENAGPVRNALKELKEEGLVRKADGLYECTALGDCYTISLIRLIRTNFDRAVRLPDGRVRLYRASSAPDIGQMVSGSTFSPSTFIFSQAKSHLEKTFSQELFFNGPPSSTTREDSQNKSNPKT